ncbi:hypothetical protein WJX84_003137 [Apatococcus fuscideae]|uniref:Fungal lipase-type domain-containing protein n=1 Tax=Apatococcus fuscideae TaxID=2026836 RepID=A0AAW1SPD7_9CHLO
MGGGVGAIVTLLLREPGGAPPELGPVRCIGIGPAAVFTQDLAEACNPFMISVVHGTDIVPSISYSSVEGIFLDLVSASPMRRAAKDIGRRFNETIEGIKVSTAVALKPPQIIQELGPMLPGFACIPSLAEDAAAIAAATAAAKARQSLPGTEMEVEIQMQPMERQHLADTDPASDEASGSHTVLPTTYGVAVASPVTEKHEADSRHEPSHREPQGMNQSADGSDKKEARQAAADVMGEDEDGAGQRGDPTPLFPAGRVLWLMTPELAEFASHGAAHPPQYGADQPEGSRQPQPSSQSQLLLNPTLSHAPSQQQDPAPSLPGSLKGSRSAPSLSRQASYN